MFNFIKKLMPEEINRHYVFIRFQDPDKFKDSYII